ncbi:MAG: 1-acyl-sn-glycerol-3-phosphate acyltransferase [Calothrix sp. MO_167.B12]|nr:1-acyl-sn-glycerol-3-phosphate acyltransferase [Calothrix sp. MO_167.B12]
MFNPNDHRVVTPPEYRAQPKLKFIPQQVNPFILRLAVLMLPILLRLRLRPWLPAGITEVKVSNAETLATAYQQFQAGKTRLLFAFRHSEVDDPLSIIYLFTRTLPRTARKLGISLQYPFYSHFMYDRGMTMWAGKWLGWVFSRLGGIPIHRGKKLDREAIRTARDLLINGKMPMTIAPEGATNGHSEVVSPLEPGTAQLGFWCVEDLQKAHRSEEVFIVPIGIQYYYVTLPWSKLDWLLSKLEADCGLPVQRIGKSAGEMHQDIFYQRLLDLSEYVITQMEEFYRHFYNCQFPDHHAYESDEAVLVIRLQTLLDRALQVCEQYLQLQPQGNVIDRCRRIEEAGWNRIYRQDVADIQTLSPFERGLADWIAHESSIRMRHMRLVESFVAVTGTYIQEKPSPERFAETTLIIFDAIARIKGIKVPRRPRLGWRRSQVTIGTPISVTQYWLTCKRDSHREHRQAVKKAVNDLTTELQIALEGMISF